MPVPARRPISWGRRARRASLWLLALALIAIGADWLLPPDLSRARQLSTETLDRHGAPLHMALAADGRWRLPVRVPDIDPRFLRLLILMEDKRFADHLGVDPLAALRALGQVAAEGRVVSGASTLTMQTARLLEPRARTLGAKLVETLRALQLERRHTKSELLELYLTLAPYGGNLEGLRAATLAWFGKEPASLTLGEAALLIALPQAPEARRPDRHPRAAAAARARVLARLAELGAITAAEAAAAAAEPLPDRRRPLPRLAPAASALALRRAGPLRRVPTTLDRGLQLAMEDLLRSETAWYEPGATASLVLVELAGREVRAWVGNARPDGPAGQIDMARRLRSPGSALKPFVYALAFDDTRLHPETILRDEPTRFGDYAPRNFTGSHYGAVTVREALQYSLNVPAVAILESVGPGRFLEHLRAAGAQIELADQTQAPGLPVALGGLGITLEDLVRLTAAIPSGGRTGPLRFTVGVRTEGDEREVMGAVAAWYLADILAGTPSPGGAPPLPGGVPVAHKTGTSYGFRDAWAVGFTGSHVIGVWVGRPDGTPRPGQYGRNAAAPLLFSALQRVPGLRPYATPRPAGALPLRLGTAELPPALRYFASPSQPAGLDRTSGRLPPRITFPPEGARLDLPVGARDVTFDAEGGLAPLRWYVDGRPLRAENAGRSARFTPDGPGFLRATVVDAEGRVASVSFRIE